MRQVYVEPRDQVRERETGTLPAQIAQAEFEIELGRTSLAEAERVQAHAVAFAEVNLSVAEGGMITTDDELAEQMRLMSLHGISRDAWKRYTSEGSWYYEVICTGYKDNMTDIQVALGIHQLARLERFLAVRADYARIYNEAFAKIPEVQTPVIHSDVRHAWYLYVIQLDLDRLTIDRAQFIQALCDRNVGTSVHFIPVHLHPYYREKYGYKRGDLQNVERAYDRIVSLPLYSGMTVEDVHYVIGAESDIVGRHECEKEVRP